MEEGGNMCVQVVNVEWKIERFFHLPKKVNYILKSPLFTISNVDWYLRFHPNGEMRSNSEWIALFLLVDDLSSPISISFTLGIKRADGSELKSCHDTYEFKTANSGYGTNTLIKISEFSKLKDVVDDDGSLRIFCYAHVDDGQAVLQMPSSESSRLLEIEGYKKEIAELKEKLSSRNKGAEVLNIKNTEQGIKQADQTLSENFKELFRSQYEADTTVRVGAKEFLVHKVVLASRSSVFRAMFETDMAEKNDGVINIEDCEPGPFEDFLLFLYGGQFNIVKPSNALKLCLIADKYNVVQLKEKCFEIMSKEMSPESVCDAVYLATLYNEEELLHSATKYFVENMDTVVCSPKWFSFLSEHTAAANELLVKVAKNIKH